MLKKIEKGRNKFFFLKQNMPDMNVRHKETSHRTTLFLRRTLSDVQPLFHACLI